ncbi:hypothetical protein MAR_005453 [Mya arenaria]|uniref:Uncharacterized protein n=1 Tax=Mya arenaria TaxID=6604 RepID=A0ABY7EZJ2_MYAAR|nr:hypothetical protein MAR_005453 [Mya arenaria]
MAILHISNIALRDEPITGRHKQGSTVVLPPAYPATTQKKPQAEPLTGHDTPRSDVAMTPNYTPEVGKPNKKQTFGTRKKTGETDEENKHSKFIPTDNRNSLSSTSSTDSENAFILVSGGESPIVPKVKADHRTSTFENSYENVHLENDALDISLANPENDDQRKHGQHNITGVHKDRRPKTNTKMENKNRYQMNSASETNSENAINHVSGRADHSLTEVKKKEELEQPTHGQRRIQEGMDDNPGYQIDTNSLSASETKPENAMAHVVGREGNSLKAFNNKEASPWMKERINVLERSLKFKTTMGKGLQRSCSSSILQGARFVELFLQKRRLRLYRDSRVLLRQLYPWFQGARTPLQDESLYENSQDLYENSERPCQEK